MSSSGQSSNASPSVALRIDQICDEFEAEWRAGKSPRIEDVLNSVTEPERSVLVRELVPLEIEYRRQRGEVPSLEEYWRRFPMEPFTWLNQSVNKPAAAKPDYELPLTAPLKVSLAVIAGPNQGKTFAFERHDTFIVGRGSTAHLKLPPKDKFFSRNHFLLEINPPLCRLTNLSKTNGTFVNGQRVSVVDLQDGDVILGGDTAIRVSIGTSAEQVGPPSVESLDVASDSSRASQQATELKPTEPNTNAAAQDIGPYELIRELGRGGMGTVYLAKHAASGQLCAVKTIQPGGQADEADVQRFVREATILEQLRHRHIVSYQAFGHDANQVYLAMEYVEGEDAVQIMKREGRLPVQRAVGWICQLLEALAFAHGQGFIHRDIKPANLLIARSPTGEHLKLADFGLARVYQASTISGLTMDGEAGGSLPFIPPEQITDFRNVDPRSDIFSTGATLFNLLTGKYIHELPSKAADRILMILQDEPTDIRLHRPELPEVLCRVIQKAIARKPADRFASATEMWQALLPFRSR